mgnify:CR=1 FL=1
MAKARLYKMVNSGTIKRGGITVKVGDKTITQPTINFTKNIKALNSLGATVNSIAILTQDLKDTFQEYSRTSISNYEEQLNKRREHLEIEQNEREEEKNINTVLLLEPNSEEAMYMLINIHLKRSNYSKIKELTENFSLICSKLCDKAITINEALRNIEPKNES